MTGVSDCNLTSSPSSDELNHEFSIAQWLEHPTGKCKVIVRLPIRTTENFSQDRAFGDNRIRHTEIFPFKTTPCLQNNRSLQVT